MAKYNGVSQVRAQIGTRRRAATARWSSDPGERVNIVGAGARPRTHLET